MAPNNRLNVATPMAGTMGDYAGIAGNFGDEQPVDASKLPPAKRVCLRHYDLPPMQLLNPMGESGIDRLSLEKLWQLLKAGDRQAESFCNLCFEDKRRQSIGISQLSEVLMHLCDKVRTCPFLPLLIKEEVLSEVKKEAEALYPHLKVLNQGAIGRTPSTQTLRQAAYAGNTAGGTPESIDAQKRAAKELHQWLSQERSKLRGFIAALSANGVFFVAQAHEKAGRVYVRYGDGTAEGFGAAIATREVQGLLAASAETDYAALA